MNYLINAVTKYIVQNSLGSDEESLFAINGFEDISIYANLCKSITEELSSSGKTISIKLANRKWEYFKEKYSGSPYLLQMQQKEWIADGKSTTYYRNLHATDVLILMGTEEEDDAIGSLKEIVTITPASAIELVVKTNGVTRYDTIFDFTNQFSDEHKNFVNKLYRDLFEFITPDLIKLSNHADEWNNKVSTFNEFLALFYGKLPEWGLPLKTDNYPKPNQLKGRANLLRQEFNFINGTMFNQLSASKYRSYKAKLDKYEIEQKRYSSIWEEWPNQALANYSDFSEALLEYIGGERTLLLKSKLMHTNFSVVEDVLGLKLDTKTTEVGVKIYGNPLNAFTQEVLDILTEMKEKEDAPSFSKIVFKFCEATVVADNDEDDSLINQWRNICIHTNGVFEYINNKAMFTMDGEEISIVCEPANYFEITKEAKPYVNKASGNKTTNKVEFRVQCINDEGDVIAESPKKECEWIFKYNEDWVNDFSELCSQDFVNTANNAIIPIATNKKLKSLVLSKSQDDFIEILKEESDTEFGCNLLDSKIHPSDFIRHKLYPDFCALGMLFASFANEVSSEGLYNVLADSSGKNTLSKFVDAYTKLGKTLIKEKVNENEYYILNYYIHAFNIEENDSSVTSEKEIQYCIVPPWHPASLEKYKHMCIFFIDGCHEYWKNVEDNGLTPSKKLTSERVDELNELSLFQNAVDLFPTSGSAFFGVTKNYGLYTIYARKDIKAESRFRDLIDKDAVFDDDFKAKSYSVMNDDALMVFNVIENYIKAFPNSKDNLSLVFVDPVELQPVIAAVHKYIEEFHSKYGNDSMLSITLRVLVKPENMGGKNYLTYWMNETFDLDSFVKVKTYLNVWNDREELNEYLDENNDIVFVMDLLKTNDYSFINKLDAYIPSHSECYFPIVFRPGLISVTHSKKRIIELTQPQFEAATAHTQAVYYKSHTEKVPDGSYYAVKNVLIDDNGENIVKDLHKKSYWVVCIDNGMDGALLKDEDKSSQDYSVIGFSTGKGRFGQYNLTITARNSVVQSIEKRFAERLAKMFHWDSHLISIASKICMDEASYLDGVSVLRASNKNDFNINEFMAYVLTSLREKERGRQSPLKTIVHLDSYKHWFSGKGDTKSIFDDDFSQSRPDFLVLEVDPDYTNKVKIHAKIVECKIAGFENKNEHISKAIGQAKHGVEVLSKIFDPSSESLKRRYWFAQLYRALAFAQVTFTNSSDEFKEVSNKLRDILNGLFEIDWTSEILGYWVNLKGDCDTEEIIDTVRVNNIPQVRIQKLLLGDNGQNVIFEPDVDVSIFRDENEEAEIISNREKEIEEELEKNRPTSKPIYKVQETEKKYQHVDFVLEDTVILMNAYLNMVKTKETISTTSNELSKVLRNWAVGKGYDIDAAYRSAEGLQGRLRTIGKAYEGNDYNVPAIFKEVVELYKNNRDRFTEILMHELGIDNNSTKEGDANNQIVNANANDSAALSNSELVAAKAPIPEINKSEIRVMIGKTKSQEKIYWEFGHKQLANRHLLITGTSGQGKTYGIQTMLYELSKSNVSSVIFDYTEGFTPDQLEPKFKELMGERIHQEIVISTGVPINPFKRQEIEVAGIKMPEKVENVASRIASIFTHVYNFGEQQYSAIFNAARNGMKKYGNQMNMDYFKDELEKVKSSNPAAKTVISKMEPFLYSIEFTGDGSFDWGKIIYSDKAMVNIFQLTHIDRDMQVIITELLLWDAWYYTQKVGTKDKPFVVVLDEAQNLSHKDSSPSAKILTEGRKFGWSAWYATQSLKVLSDEEVVRLMQSAFKLYFKPTDDEITKISKQIDPTDGTAWVPAIKNLNKGQCIVVGDRIKTDGSFGSSKPTVVLVESFERRD